MVPREHRKGILVFLSMTFLLSWTIWELGFFLFGDRGFMSPALQAAIMPLAFAPAFAAFVVRKWVTREGFGDAGLRLNLKRWPYYAAAVLIPSLVVGFIVAVAPFVGIEPDFSRSGFREAMGITEPLRPWVSALIVTPLIGAFVYALFYFGEEFGWRGYLQLRLYRGEPLKAAVATGVIWGVWHYPLVWHGRHYTEDNILAGLICFPILCILLSIIFGWLRLRTGSIWGPSLGHGAANAIGATVTTMLFLGGDGLIWAGFGQPLGWIPLAAVCAVILATGQLRPQQSSAA